MPSRTKSPILEFLTTKENLPAVLDVICYAEEIRRDVAERFWHNLQEALKKHPKADNFSWTHDLTDEPDGYFALNAQFVTTDEKNEALHYKIETSVEYFGVGLAWNQKTSDFETLCRKRPLRLLSDFLNQRRRGGDIEPEPNGDWFWWEYWERNPYPDPWSWFGKDFGMARFNGLAKKFWDFVTPTLVRVQEANRELRRF